MWAVKEDHYERPPTVRHNDADREQPRYDDVGKEWRPELHR